MSSLYIPVGSVVDTKWPTLERAVLSLFRWDDFANAVPDYSLLTSVENFRWQVGVTPFTQWYVPLLGGLIYLITIGTLWITMRKREAMDGPIIQTLLVLHNIINMIISVVCTVGVAVDVYLSTQTVGLERTLCAQEASPVHGRLFYWCYLYYLSKFYELLDTVFIVLKKKPLLALHVYHHCVMMPTTWVGLTSEFTWGIWNAVLFNSFVHIIMYHYYLCQSLKWEYKWKKVVTIVQLVQFFLGFLAIFPWAYLYFKSAEIAFGGTGWYEYIPVVTYTKNCTGELPIVVFMCMVDVSFLFLFSQFYIRTFIQRSLFGRKKHNNTKKLQ